MGLFTERDEETTNEIIIGKLNRIEAKLDAVIKAMHEYDGDEWDEPNDALKEAAAQYNERMHHVTNEEADEDAKWKKAFDQFHEQFRDDKDEDEFDDYGKRVVRDSNNTQPKQKQYYKNKRSKRNENKK